MKATQTGELLTALFEKISAAENLSSPSLILPPLFFHGSVSGNQNARQNIQQLIGERINKIK